MDNRVWRTLRVGELWIGDTIQGFGEITDLEPEDTTSECGDPECCPGGPEILSWRIKSSTGAEIVWDSDTEVCALS